jgi:thiamine-monophosphate kinase
MASLSEFDLIADYFSDLLTADADLRGIALGVGDDAAILNIEHGAQLVFSIDTQLAGVHFPEQADPEKIALRAFHAALSDLSAMGAKPLCFTLALTLPAADADWLQSFAVGLKSAVANTGCSLVGGDTTRGPLSVTIQVHGTVPKGKALLRSAAKVGDHVFVSGYLGNAAAYVQLALQNPHNNIDKHALSLFEADYYQPLCRAVLGAALRERANAAIDISDGLLADLGHICRASKLGARIDVEKLPLIPELKTTFDRDQQLDLALNGGDDYELCFTVPEDKCREVIKMAEDMECPVTDIGIMVDDSNVVTCHDAEGNHLSITAGGYTHF